MHEHKVTPKDFFLWAGAMISLYVSVFSLLSLLFSYIDWTYPDVLSSYSYVDPYSGAMRAAIASLVVLFPLLLVLMRFIRKDIQKEPAKKDLWIRRWALFLTVFVAGATVAIDLITLVNYFLGGEITVRFVLKVTVVFLVIGAAFLHFLADIWGFWNKHPRRAQAVGFGAGAVVALAIVAGFLIMGSPAQIRLQRLDDQKVNDLTNIQYQIVNYWQQHESLPSDLSQLEDPLSGYDVIPRDPQTGESYAYSATGTDTFRLCAVFNAPVSDRSNSYNVARPMPASVGMDGKEIDSTWKHDAGNTCFDRTIDPLRYPLYNKSVQS